MGELPQQTLEQVTDWNSSPVSSSQPVELNEADSDGDPLRALIVDPSLASQKTLQRIFEHHQIHVEICYKGNEAVQRINQENFDFICVSVPLEDLTDEEVFRSLQSIKRNHSVPNF